MTRAVLQFAVGLSRKSRGIIKQNLVISLGVNLVLLASTAQVWPGSASR
jgi:cation transport ATPase